MGSDIPVLFSYPGFLLPRGGGGAEGQANSIEDPSREESSLEENVEWLMGALRSGEVALNPFKREDIGGVPCSVLDMAMLDCSTSERFEVFRPLLKWIHEEEGLSPWQKKEAKGGRPIRGYDWIVSWGQEVEEKVDILEWCWGLPESPEPEVGNVPDQIIHDQLGAIILKEKPMDSKIIREVDRLGLDILKEWANGVRPMDMLLEHALPWNDCNSESIPWDGPGPDGRKRVRKAHEWLEVVRDISRVGLSVLNRSSKLTDVHIQDVLRVRALLWAHALRAFKAYDAEEPVAAVLRNFDRKLGRALKLGLKGEGLHRALHEKTLDWFLKQPPSYDMARLALEMEVAFGVETPYGDGKVGVGVKVTGAKDDPVAVAERMLSLAGILGDDLMTLKPYEERGRVGVPPWAPWQKAWSAVSYACMMKDSPVLAQIKQDPNLWNLALPALAQAAICPGRDLMLEAMEAGNHPKLDLGSKKVSSWESVFLRTSGTPDWDRRVEAIMLGRKMDEVLPSPENSGEDLPPTPKLRF